MTPPIPSAGTIFAEGRRAFLERYDGISLRHRRSSLTVRRAWRSSAATRSVTRVPQRRSCARGAAAAVLLGRGRRRRKHLDAFISSAVGRASPGISTAAARTGWRTRSHSSPRSLRGNIYGSNSRRGANAVERASRRLWERYRPRDPLKFTRYRGSQRAGTCLFFFTLPRRRSRPVPARFQSAPWRNLSSGWPSPTSRRATTTAPSMTKACGTSIRSWRCAAKAHPPGRATGAGKRRAALDAMARCHEEHRDEPSELALFYTGYPPGRLAVHAHCTYLTYDYSTKRGPPRTYARSARAGSDGRADDARGEAAYSVNWREGRFTKPKELGTLIEENSREKKSIWPWEAYGVAGLRTFTRGSTLGILTL